MNDHSLNRFSLAPEVYAPYINWMRGEMENDSFKSFLSEELQRPPPPTSSDPHHWLRATILHAQRRQLLFEILLLAEIATALNWSTRLIKESGERRIRKIMATLSKPMAGSEPSSCFTQQCYEALSNYIYRKISSDDLIEIWHDALDDNMAHLQKSSNEIEYLQNAAEVLVTTRNYMTIKILCSLDALTESDVRPVKRREILEFIEKQIATNAAGRIP